MATLFDKLWEMHRVADAGDGYDLLAVDRLLLHKRTDGVVRAEFEATILARASSCAPPGAGLPPPRVMSWITITPPELTDLVDAYGQDLWLWLEEQTRIGVEFPTRAGKCRQTLASCCFDVCRIAQNGWPQKYEQGPPGS